MLLSFALTCLIIEITPGPNMAYLAILSASHGRRAGFAAILGVALGLFIIGLAAALGVATAISNSPFIYHLLRWFGVLYLLWLAWDGWHLAKDTSAGKIVEIPPNTEFFKRGLITNLLNPKAAVFYIAILPNFIGESTPVLPQTAMLTLVYVVIATAVHCIVVGLAATASRILNKPRQILILRRILSLMLAGVALWFAIATGKGLS